MRIKTEWDMEYRIWDIDRADEDEDEGRLKALVRQVKVGRPR